MPSIHQLKPAFQGLLRPLVRTLARAGITANQVTVAAVLLAATVGALLLAVPDRRILLLLPLALFLRMALNAIDGMLAREHGQVSTLGAILNELGDVVSDAAMFLPLALRPEFPATPVVVLVVLAVVVEMTGVIGVQIGASRRYDGPLGKSDRAFALGALGLLLGLGLPEGGWIGWLLWALVALSALTVVNRARHALAETERQAG
ncbi:CDP-alcohol phosphatidyltransferase family protein [Dokdonella sp.]|uniref:CDP-alcohol phosphatidyltransferase family protein n=1 Tax=Dokdonella sp. TaxID=2291710 RepID=UPI0026353838|nr:CDP-alcohol phosphatidyltransferase family protein [Dokdonella sp.]